MKPRASISEIIKGENIIRWLSRGITIWKNASNKMPLTMDELSLSLPSGGGGVWVSSTLPHSLLTTSIIVGN